MGRQDAETETLIPTNGGVFDVAHSLRGEGFNGSEDGTGRGTPLVAVHAFDARQSDVLQYGDMTGPIDADGHSVAVAFTQNQRDEVREMHVAGALASNSGAKQQTYLHRAMQVRRLTPRECERLQGFPDEFTAIPYRGKPASQCADGPRYKALGNSMAVPVMAWIGRRIAAVDAIGAMETQQATVGF
jgi:DNA (cytosine-5)-methyltransferase 1